MSDPADNLRYFVDFSLNAAHREAQVAAVAEIDRRRAEGTEGHPMTDRLRELDALTASIRAEPNPAVALERALASLAVAMEELARLRKEPAALDAGGRGVGSSAAVVGH